MKINIFVIFYFLSLFSSCSPKHNVISYIDSSQNKVNIYSVEKGKGQPIIFIHGNSFEHSVWEKQFKSEALMNFHLIAYDLRGHGKSVHFSDPEKYPTQYSLKYHAEDLAEVIRYYNLKNPVVVGWSLGGNIILRYLSDHPAPAFGKALIFGATPSFGLSGDKNFPETLPSAEKDYFMREFLLNPEPTDEAMEKFVKAALNKDERSMIADKEIGRWKRVIANTDGYARVGILGGYTQISEDISDGKLDMSLAEFNSRNSSQVEMLKEISRINIPVRVILSDNDFFPVSHVMYLQKLNPVYFSISKPYHMGHAIFYTSPEIFQRELTDFLQN